MTNYSEVIDFNGPTWRAIKAWAEEKQAVKLKLLIGADSHDKSNQLRGSLQNLSELLALDKAADTSR